MPLLEALMRVVIWDSFPCVFGLLKMATITRLWWAVRELPRQPAAGPQVAHDRISAQVLHALLIGMLFAHEGEGLAHVKVDAADGPHHVTA